MTESDRIHESIDYITKNPDLEAGFMNINGAGMGVTRKKKRG